MRYWYCPRDDRIRPMKRSADGRCDICLQDCVQIRVKHSIHGYIMYALDIVAAIMIVLYLAHYQFDADFASFVRAVNEVAYIGAMFALIFVSFIFSGLDMVRMQAEALRIGREGRDGT
ncbi:MAG TPA: hypothetical protein PLI21_02710 [Methanomassiliicoccaceae archaeon]|jgi:hypothetical protein|nr:hypothetical protein [Euryarchaeota archaeon]HOB37473.1 hypothetical protein [Methanomassiliicoccaceae archaeon]HOK27917.1 hypothetical protein [Methanomassiliicoccaceae archaeon]HOL07066.1 hypothetical protein [Methanomassiliicoccaceae archaeon]HOQ26830.1 hypothetical protein [Methanomassiliicoccaceae archaeon]